MTMHTEGPWTNADCPAEIIGKGGEIVALAVASTHAGQTWTIDPKLGDLVHLPEAQANARLIAAAPDLLEALTACVEAMAIVTEGNPMGVGKNSKCAHGRYGFEGCESCTDNTLDPALEIARAAITKATESKRG